MGVRNRTDRGEEKRKGMGEEMSEMVQVFLGSIIGIGISIVIIYLFERWNSK